MSTVPLPRHSVFPARHAAPPGVDAGPAHLLRLVRRIALEDRTAFADLYDALAARLLRQVQASTADPVQAAAITCATFVEVWMLARGHVDPDTDVYAWITDIVGRRAADRQPAGRTCTQDREPWPRPWWAAAPDLHDRQMVLSLCSLLTHTPSTPWRRHAAEESWRVHPPIRA
jgi:DNA-directed RNA polymerase specialized sigma24 family protein